MKPTAAGLSASVSLLDYCEGNTMEDGGKWNVSSTVNKALHGNSLELKRVLVYDQNNVSYRVLHLVAQPGHKFPESVLFKLLQPAFTAKRQILIRLTWQCFPIFASDYEF